MKLRVDKESDAIYLRLDDSTVVESEEVRDGVILDFDESGKVVAIELLNLSERYSQLDSTILQLETD